MTIILLLFVSSSSLDAVPQSVTPPPTPVEINELPENMPLVTRLLWGEQGLIRTLGLAPKDRIAELKLRTFMLQTHQKFALGTVALLSGQTYTGMLMAKGKQMVMKKRRRFIHPWRTPPSLPTSSPEA